MTKNLRMNAPLMRVVEIPQPAPYLRDGDSGEVAVSDGQLWTCFSDLLEAAARDGFNWIEWGNAETYVGRPLSPDGKVELRLHGQTHIEREILCMAVVWDCADTAYPVQVHIDKGVARRNFRWKGQDVEGWVVLTDHLPITFVKR